MFHAAKISNVALSTYTRLSHRSRHTSFSFAIALQRFTLTCGREERFFATVSLLPRASIVHDNK